MASLPSTIVGIDMGNSSWKAVRLDKKGSQYSLTKIGSVPGILDVKNPLPPTEQSVAAKMKELGSLVKAGGADVHFSINSVNSTVRYVELPNIPLPEIRTALKINSSTHLRQNFENYTFDACPLDSDNASKNPKAKKGAAVGGKVKMIVGGISTAEVIIYFHAARRASFRPKSLQLSSVSLINGFETSLPEIFQTQAVVLLDFGFLSSTLTILDKGRPLLTRAVPTGAKQLTEYIAQVTSSDFTKAEASKINGDPTLSEAVTRTSVTLIREIRSSINFFEKNSDIPISKVYLTGSSVASPAVVEALSKDIGSACEVWDASAGLKIELNSEQQGIFNQNRSAFSAALGAARTYTVAPVPAVAAPANPKKDLAATQVGGKGPTQ
jgi:type IV pilus assembly protein PilM